MGAALAGLSGVEGCARPDAAVGIGARGDGRRRFADVAVQRVACVDNGGGRYGVAKTGAVYRSRGGQIGAYVGVDRCGGANGAGGDAANRTRRSADVAGGADGDGCGRAAGRAKPRQVVPRRPRLVAAKKVRFRRYGCASTARVCAQRCEKRVGAATPKQRRVLLRH